MKHLNQFITEYIVKKKLDKFIDSEYLYHPKNKDELIEDINELLDLRKYDLNSIDTSAITDMSHLFEDDVYVDRNFDVSRWNVSNVKNMTSMFNSCTYFNCDLSNWDVSNVETMDYTFLGCEHLNYDLSNWDVSNVKSMKGMFQNCDKFEGKGLDKWNVSNVKDMYCMFINCENLNCDFSSWDVSNVIHMHYMFYGCKKFDCDLSNWDVSNVKDKRYMFYNCTSLKNKPSWYEEE